MNERLKVGDRVVVLTWARTVVAAPDPVTGLIHDENGDVVTIDDNITVPPGTEGVVTGVEKGTVYRDGRDAAGRECYWVDWANGRRLKLLPSDAWELV